MQKPFDKHFSLSLPTHAFREYDFISEKIIMLAVTYIYVNAFVRRNAEHWEKK